MPGPTWVAVAMIAALLAFGQFGAAQDQDQAADQLESAVTAPPNTRSLSDALGGAYFVDEKLLDRYEALKVRVAQIRDEIASGAANSDEALEALAAIQEESKRLRDELEQQKVLVSAFNVYSKTSEQTFPLWDERLVIITGDNVILRGWEGPGIKCVVEKIILAKQPPDDSEFDAIAVEHKLEVAEGMVGLTRAERDRQEQEFLDSEEGRKLTDEQKASRKKFVDEIHHSYDDFLAFQGRAANTLQLTGLTYEQGNRNLTLRITSPDGGGSVSSEWQRHATMTVYVPTCQAVAVRGCQAGLDIQNLECDLVLSAHGSRDRQYDGSFIVRGIKGDVTIDQAPVRELSNVTGNVVLRATDEFVNSGTHHVNDTRTFSPYEMHATKIDQIGGNLQATILRTDLELRVIEGTIDVVNQFGDTHLTWDRLDADRAHRIVSESGTIQVSGPESVLKKTPIYAHTQCGRLHTNIEREVLDDVSFSTGRPRQGWNGMVTPSKDRFDFSKFERPAAALENRERAAGLDLISRAGAVSILTTETAE